MDFPLPPLRPPLGPSIVAAEPVTGIDATAADVLAHRPDLLQARKVALHLAELKDPVKDKPRRFGLYERFGDEGLHPTIEAAVDAYCAARGVEPLP